MGTDQDQGFKLGEAAVGEAALTNDVEIFAGGAVVSFLLFIYLSASAFAAWKRRRERG